ncbi:MAG: hypothetical protein AAFN10_19145 [Bacteroidota bacterium]
MKLRNFYFIWWTTATLIACNPPISWPTVQVEKLVNPADTASVFPSLSADSQQLWMGWLDEKNKEESSYQIASFDGNNWSSAQRTAQGNDWFVNWADFPTITALNDQHLLLHTLEKSGPDPYAYDIKLRFRDQRLQWSQALKPYEDSSATEHGFPSFVPLDGERSAAIWLDGRNYAEGGNENMMLAYSEFDQKGHASPTQFLDQRVCDCCQTDMAMSSQGLIAVYRDRSPQEVRDIYLVRQEDDKWTEPKPLHPDNWQINGCPVNGPAIAAKGDTVAVAWFTSAGGEARVLGSLSFDAGKNFSKPSLIDAAQALGRVDIVLDQQNRAWVSWIRKDQDTAQIQLCTFKADGSKSPAYKIHPINPRRKSGFPQLMYWQNKMWLAWTATEPQNQIQIVKITIDG